MTAVKRKRGRPRKDIRFFSDNKANRQWNAERGKVNKPQSRLQATLAGANKKLKERLCMEWRVPVIVDFDFVNELEYNQEELRPALEAKLRVARESGNRNRQKGGQFRSEAADAERKRIMTHPRVTDVVRKVSDAQLSANAAAQIIRKNWRHWKFEGIVPGDRRLRGWIAAVSK